MVGKCGLDRPPAPNSVLPVHARHGDPRMGHVGVGEGGEALHGGRGRAFGLVQPLLYQKRTRQAGVAVRLVRRQGHERPGVPLHVLPVVAILCQAHANLRAEGGSRGVVCRGLGNGSRFVGSPE